MARTPACSLPKRAGIGFKPEHFGAIVATRPDLGFFEIHAENYMVAGGPFPHFLREMCALYPLSVHGVGLSLGGEKPPDKRHLGRVQTLLQRFPAAAFSEHLAWSRHDGVFYNDLLPLPYNELTLRRVCEHVDAVQQALQRPMLLENPATYLGFDTSSRAEGQFLDEVACATGCGLLLDLNNLYVSCRNHGREVHAALAAFPFQHVRQFHLAGFAEDVDEEGAVLLIDNHGAAIAEAVWQLYAQALQITGPLPTLIERDQSIPPLPVLLAEAWRADRLAAADPAQNPSVPG